MTEQKNTVRDGSPAVWKTAITLQSRGDNLELRFTGKFSPADLEAVKAIRGRRWDGERRVWLLPHAQAVLDALRNSFRYEFSTSAPGAHDATSPRASVPAQPAPVTAPEPYDSAASRILDELRRMIRTREYSPKTERSYIGWIRRFLRFHGKTVDHPNRLASEHATSFLQYLALNERLAARSRNQAAAALGFMFREILGRDEMSGVPRAKGPRNEPMVLSHREELRVLEQLRGKFFLIVVLLYSAGLRLEECLRLRIKDIDFELRQILIRDGKGQKDRYVPLARRAAELLRVQITHTTDLHRKDRLRGHGWAPLPAALHRKDPEAGFEIGWQFIFPASTVNRDAATGRTGRWSLHATAVQRGVKVAVRRSGLAKPATCHTFRHSFATEMLRGGCDIRTLQDVMGHKDIRTTTIYLHVVEQTGYHLQSPLDRPDPDDELTADAEVRPFTPTTLQWDLAARQWPKSSGSHTYRAPRSSPSGTTGPGKDPSSQ
jgi:integron integrase